MFKCLYSRLDFIAVSHESGKKYLLSDLLAESKSEISVHFQNGTLKKFLSERTTSSVSEIRSLCFSGLPLLPVGYGRQRVIHDRIVSGIAHEVHGMLVYDTGKIPLGLSDAAKHEALCPFRRLNSLCAA